MVKKVTRPRANALINCILVTQLQPAALHAQMSGDKCSYRREIKGRFRTLLGLVRIALYLKYSSLCNLRGLG